jgi:hypothetical protein
MKVTKVIYADDNQYEMQPYEEVVDPTEDDLNAEDLDEGTITT